MTVILLGARVLMSSPHGEYRKGSELGALLIVKNGSPGVVVARTEKHAVVAFDDMRSVGVNVPEHWLAVAP